MPFVHFQKVMVELVAKTAARVATGTIHACKIAIQVHQERLALPVGAVGWHCAPAGGQCAMATPLPPLRISTLFLKENGVLAPMPHLAMLGVGCPLWVGASANAPNFQGHPALGAEGGVVMEG